MATRINYRELDWTLILLNALCKTLGLDDELQGQATPANAGDGKKPAERSQKKPQSKSGKKRSASTKADEDALDELDELDDDADDDLDGSYEGDADGDEFDNDDDDDDDDDDELDDDTDDDTDDELDEDPPKKAHARSRTRARAAVEEHTNRKAEARQAALCAQLKRAEAVLRSMLREVSGLREEVVSLRRESDQLRHENAGLREESTSLRRQLKKLRKALAEAGSDEENTPLSKAPVIVVEDAEIELEAKTEAKSKPKSKPVIAAKHIRIVAEPEEIEVDEVTEIEVEEETEIEEEAEAEIEIEIDTEIEVAAEEVEPTDPIDLRRAFKAFAEYSDPIGEAYQAIQERKYNRARRTLIALERDIRAAGTIDVGIQVFVRKLLAEAEWGLKKKRALMTMSSARDLAIQHLRAAPTLRHLDYLVIVSMSSIPMLMEAGKTDRAARERAETLGLIQRFPRKNLRNRSRLAFLARAVRAVTPQKKGTSQ